MIPYYSGVFRLPIKQATLDQPISLLDFHWPMKIEVAF